MPRLPIIALTVALTASLVVPAWAQEPAAVAKPLAMLTSLESELDAGEVLEGEVPRFKFTLVNNGDRAVKLRVLTSCGCTVARHDPEIAAGGKATLEATLNTAKMKGQLVKMITVRAEEEAMGKVELRVKALVRPLVRVEPSNAAFVIVKDRVPNKVEFTLAPEPGKGIEFKEVVSSSPYFLARLVPPSSPGGPTKVVVAVTPDAPPGHLQSNLAVITSSTAVPRIGLVVTGEKGIRVSPRTVFWGGITPASPAAREEIMLTKRGGRFAIRGVSAADPAIRPTVETVAEGSQYRIIVTYAGGWKEGRQYTTLKIQTDDPAQPEIVIPVQALVGSAAKSAGVF